MSWLRMTLVACSSLLLLVLVLVGLLLFTSMGNQLLWQQLKQALPTLQGELTDGHLGRGVTLRDLRYESPELLLQAQKLRLDWQLASLLAGRLVVDELALSQGQLVYRHVAHPEPESLTEPLADEPPVADSLLYLPLDLQLKKLRVEQLAVLTPDVEVRVGQLQAAASWQGTQLRLLSSHSADVDVKLVPSPVTPEHPGHPAPVPPEPEAKPLAQPFDEQSIRQQIEALPTVFLPFDLSVEQFAVHKARYHQRGFDTGLFDVSLQGRFKGTDLNVEALQIAHPMGDLALHGEMKFVTYYPMQVTLTGVSKVDWLEKQLQGRRATLQVTGPLTDLRGQLDLEGPEAAEFKARLNTLAPDLPFETSLIWKQLRWPLRGQPEYRLLDGQLKAEGRLSAYHATVHSKAELREFPRSVLDLQLNGSLDGIELKPFKLTAADGSLELKGKLGWQRGIDWPPSGGRPALCKPRILVCCSPSCVVQPMRNLT